MSDKSLQVPGGHADAHREVRDASEQIAARCSLWWRNPLVVDGDAAGLIGQYAAATPEAGVELLQQACHDLRAHGCTLAIGPMDGSTWGNYRFVTGGTGEPPFFLEPSHPPDWPRHFVNAGFTPLARYHSTITTDLERPDPKADRAEARLLQSGCEFRTLDPSRLEDEIRSIHRISLAAFQSAFLYQPIALDEFAAAQRILTPLLRPELILLAERRGDAVGFLFAIPDHLQAQRGSPVDTVVIKTLAILPGRQQAGLGVCLARRLHHTAKALGYHRVIHALMHEANNSLNIMRPNSQPLREYTLFSRKL